MADGLLLPESCKELYSVLVISTEVNIIFLRNICKFKVANIVNNYGKFHSKIHVLGNF